MSAVTVREFAYNPSAMFARAEAGETIEVTRHGEVIARLVPPQRGGHSRYAELVDQGVVHPPRRGSQPPDFANHPRMTPPSDIDPLDVLLEQREHER